MNLASVAFDIQFILPEILLTIAAIATLIFSLLINNKRAIAYFALASLAITLFYLSKTPIISTSLFSGMLVNDPFAAFFKILAVFIAFVVILISFDYKEISQNWRGEFY